MVWLCDRGCRSFGTAARSLYDWLDSPTERWLDGVLDTSDGITLYIHTDEALRHLPWELMAKDKQFLGANQLRLRTPVRLVSQHERDTQVANRPLRVLFIATSPEDMSPVLDFEEEEATILSTIGEGRVDLVVEESGSLHGLRETIESFGEGYFDVLNLSGHAFVGSNHPVFVMEDEFGYRQDASAEEIATAARGLWPGLVFLSGCMTGQASDQGAIPSMAEALVEAGASAVMGWALWNLLSVSMTRLGVGRHRRVGP